MSPAFPPSEIADRALLLATLPSLATPHFLASVIHAAVNTTRSRLVIVLFSRLFNAPDNPEPMFRGVSHTHPDRWNDVHRLLTHVYVQATRIAHQRDNILMDIDVLLRGIDGDVPEDLGVGMDIVFRVAGDSIAVPLPQSISSLRQSFLPSGDHDPASSFSSTAMDPPFPPPPPPSTATHPPFFPVVALGGTFDHLHAGHKILLSMAAWIASRKIIVGITDDVLLTKKAHAHVLQRLPVRIARVRAFLTLFTSGLRAAPSHDPAQPQAFWPDFPSPPSGQSQHEPGITYDIVPITDVYGPTGWDPDVQALVVSAETRSGAEAIAIHRTSKHLPPLETYTIDVIGTAGQERLDAEDLDMLRRGKMSSTYIREWIVERSKEEEEEGEDESREEVGGHNGDKPVGG